ncbi:hypothetical protein DENIS_1622 [Desulfonema ishimotonii]|uniref:Glycosyltransferase 2-like domain-containing protein n=1 Tax=Desulfonema ishimotonii TaxID=45657 RepID=A0A401FUN2_9BACT|nr:glycosyltransferase [Desulfonema ishimotonii]GBC60665.1 hypothetical protein DENIS_1622 [Desulfonema ishimotonii]
MTSDLQTLFNTALCFEKPERLTNVTSWHGHIPFAMAAVGWLKPRTLVELGTHRGDSYCAFCQTVKASATDCACYAVDTWEGDPQAGLYGPEIYDELQAWHNPRYGDFSTLLKMRFDDAVSRFENGSVDLLHIDGLHTCEAVKHDFETWLPKMSPRGVVLFHDTQVFGRDFGVWKFWEEIKAAYPYLEFFHSHGLGVLGVGDALPEEVAALFQADGEDAIRVRRFFSGLGEIISQGREVTDADRKRLSRVLDSETPVFRPESPKISVIIPAYNHEQYIREAVYSVLGQSVTDFELIIVDDGSQDHTGEIIRAIEDPRIQYYHQENQGAHNTINRGIGLARGEYVSILNSDDAYDPRRFEIFLEALEQDDSLSAVFSRTECVDGEGGFLRYETGPENPDENAILLSLLADNFLISTSNLFCRNDVFKIINGFSNLRYAHDYDFFLKLCYRFKVRIIDKSLFKYRIHSTNTIRENEAETDFEVGLILAVFFMNCDLRRLFPADDMYRAMAAFLKTLDRRHTDRMILTLMFFGERFGIRGDAFFEVLTEDRENPFRQGCVDFFRTWLNMWQNAQEVWQKWEKTDKKLAEVSADAKRWWQESRDAWQKWEKTDKKLAEASADAKKWWQESQDAWQKWEKTNTRLIETDKKLAEASGDAKKWWQESQSAWQKWEETNTRLIKTDEKLTEANERFAEAEKQIEALMNSASFRIGNAVTWPARKIVQKGDRKS